MCGPENVPSQNIGREHLDNSTSDDVFMLYGLYGDLGPLARLRTRAELQPTARFGFFAAILLFQTLRQRLYRRKIPTAEKWSFHKDEDRLVDVSVCLCVRPETKSEQKKPP